MEDQNVYHHYPDEPRINVKIEKNSRGYNYEATVTGAKSGDEALALLAEIDAKLKAAYGAAAQGAKAE